MKQLVSPKGERQFYQHLHLIRDSNPYERPHMSGLVAQTGSDALSDAERPLWDEVERKKRQKIDCAEVLVNN